jgi:hypothetical protein
VCLLSYFPAGIMPHTDELLNGTIFNDDGHGFAIVDTIGRRIIVDRGMDAKEMVYTFAAVRARYPNGPALFHSRLATDGLTNLLNCHPFDVGGDSRTVLAHNGIMPLRPQKGDPRSDTRIVAESYIPRAYGTLRRRRARLAFERWLTPWNKVVILSVDPRFRDHAFILNEDQGEWTSAGIWYSNDAYKGWSHGKYSYVWADDGPVPTVLGPRSRARDDGELRECWSCRAITDYRLGECSNCGMCFDCGEFTDFCLCYVPSRRLDQGSSMTSLG